MRTTQQLSVTLPNDMAAQVKAKVASGEYASESEVIRDGLRALQAEDRALERWLRTEVLTTYDEMRANPSRGRSVDDVRARLAAAHRRALRSGDMNYETAKQIVDAMIDKMKFLDDKLVLLGQDLWKAFLAETGLQPEVINNNDECVRYRGVELRQSAVS
jgi:putative addiction module CopG family antidote